MRHRDYLTSIEAADVIGCTRAKLYEIQELPESRLFTPERQPIAVPLDYRPAHIFALMLVNDLHRGAGVPVPHAVRVVAELVGRFDPYAQHDNLVISFHANGASIFAAAERHEVPLLPSEGFGAGPVRYRIVFELDAYREAVRRAFDRGGELEAA